jgi:hypothetical protein
VTSRTPKGKHTKRFIIEFKLAGEWLRSGNEKITGFFSTREEADAALTVYGSPDVKYRVRMK